MKIGAEFIELEPGDATCYKFMVGKISEDYIAIAEISCLTKGYLFRKDVLEDVFSDVMFLDVTEGEYQNSVIESNAFNHPFIQYVTEKLACNPWTSVAAVKAAYIFMKGGENLGIQA